MRNGLERTLALRQALAPTGELTEDSAAEIIAIFSDGDFLNQPLDLQFSFLDLVQSKYLGTSHSSAPRVAAAIQRVFQAHVRTGHAPLNRLCKTYDFLYFLYWCAAVSIEQQRGLDTGVVIPFSRYLARRLKLNGHERPADPQRNRRIRLCYLAQFAYDGAGNALAPVAETLLASLSECHAAEYELFLYAWMHKDPEFLERIKSLGVTVRSFDLSEYSEGELRRLRQSFFDDQIDVVITDMNSAVPHYLFESRVAPFQIFYQLGLPFWRLQNLDAIFQGWQIAPETLGFKPGQCHAVPAPRSARNINPPVDPARVRTERDRFPGSEHIIGFYGRLVKITPAHCDIILRILQRHAGTIVVLGGTGNADPILHFIEEHRLEERLFVVNEFVDGNVWGNFLDVFLDTFPLTGGYSCREVMAKGKPIVHMISDEMPNLNTYLDPELQATQSQEYVAHVSRLLSDAAYYRRACERAAEIAHEHADLKPFALTLHTALQEVLSGAQHKRQSLDEVLPVGQP